MDHLSPLLDILQSFLTHSLEKEWVQSVKDADFSEYCPWPESFNALHAQTNWPVILKETGRLTREYVQSQPLPVDVRASRTADISDPDSQAAVTDEPVSFWTSLAHLQLCHHDIVAVLFNFMVAGQQCESDMQEMRCGLLAAGVYINLLCVPGSSAFGLLHPALLTRAFDCFQLTSRLTTAAAGSQTDCAANHEHDEEDDDSPHQLQPHEVSQLIRLLNQVMCDVLLMCERFSLLHCSDVLQDLVQHMVQLTRVDIGVSGGAASGGDSLAALGHNAFCCLLSLCSGLHGGVPHCVSLVLRACLPSLLLRSTTTAPSRLAVLRDRTLQFVSRLVVSTGCHQQLLTLLQHVCARAPERAECRHRAAHSVIVLLQMLRDSQLNEAVAEAAISWLIRLTQHERVPQRLLALDVLARLLLSCDSHHHHDEEELVRAVAGACWDSAGAVRSRALTVLAECSVAEGRQAREAVVRAINTPASVDIQDARDTMMRNDSISAMLVRRARDSKVMVRKSAIQVIESLMTSSTENVMAQRLQILMDHCRDTALLVRKQCVTSLISLVQLYPGNDQVCEAAVRGILPQIHDPEEKVHEKVVQFVDQVIVAGITPYKSADDAAMSDTVQLPWKLLALIVKLCFQKYLLKIMQIIFAKQTIKRCVWSAVQSHVGTENNSAAWMCLALMATFSTVQQPLFALDYFVDRIGHDLKTDEVLALQQCLTVIKHSAGQLGDDVMHSVTSQLVSLISDVCLPPELLAAAVDTVAMTTLHGFTDEADYRQRLEAWCLPLLEACERFLYGELAGDESTRGVGTARDEKWETTVMRQIFTLGELAQLVPVRVNQRSFLVLLNLLYVEQDENGVVGTCDSGRFSARTRAITISSLGKLCLQHEEMAKRVVPALGKLLDVSDNQAVKNNIVFTLSDMCVRYATLVDPLLPQFVCCLCDRALVVRRNTLILLIHLLQEDYLKLKGTFFYRILQCLTDSEPEIRHLISFYLTERLLKRNPKIFFQHFVESLFVYNEYNEHESYNKLGQSERETEVFSCRGDQNQAGRMLLYKFMLQHMPDEQRFHVSHKLCQDVLGGVVDDKVSLSRGAGVCLLRDALCVLSCDDIKLQSLKCRVDDQESSGDADMADVMTAVAKKALISQVVKKNVIENMVPIVVALKHRLSKLKSPLLRELMIFLRDLMKDYKNEVQDILVSDKQLAKEIEFDMRRLHEERQSHCAATARGNVEDEDVEDGRVPAATAPASSDNAVKMNQLQPVRQMLQAAIDSAQNTTQTPHADRDGDEAVSSASRPGDAACGSGTGSAVADDREIGSGGEDPSGTTGVREEKSIEQPVVPTAFKQAITGDNTQTTCGAISATAAVTSASLTQCRVVLQRVASTPVRERPCSALSEVTFAECDLSAILPASSQIPNGRSSRRVTSRSLAAGRRGRQLSVILDLPENGQNEMEVDE